MQCPKCHSEYTQRLEVIYEGGTYDVSATGYTSGAGIAGEHLAVGSAVTETSGLSQSLLAQRCSPPAKTSYMVSVVSIIIGWAIKAASTTVFWKTSGILLMIAGIVFSYQAWQYYRHEWPNHYETWIQSWYCNKCGTIYQQQLG